MANEIAVQVSLSVRKDNVIWQTANPSYRADMSGSKGPSPGAVAIPIGGKLIYFSELTTPGICELRNLEPAGGNYVEYGIFDPQSTPAPGVFYPLGELLPGETQVIRLSRNLQEQYAGSGTGTTGPENYFYMKANKASVNVFIGAFEK